MLDGRTADMLARINLKRSFLNYALLCLTAALPLAGCKPAASPAPPNSTTGAGSPPTSLRLLVVDDKPLGEAIGRQWQSRTESELDIRYITASELDKAQRLPADVVVYPTTMLGHLIAQGLITPLESEAIDSPAFEFRDLLPNVRVVETRWGTETVSVSLGSPQLLLVYRADVFQRFNLQPPETWDEYRSVQKQLAELLAKEPSGDASSQAMQPSAEPLASGAAALAFLARSAAYVTHRDQVAALFNAETMAPLIDLPPYVRALDELVADTNSAADTQTPNQVLDAVAEGRVAMGIGFPAAVQVPDIKEDGPRSQLRFQPLPGSRDVFNFALKAWEERAADADVHASLVGLSGRQAAASSSANQPTTAANFLAWLGGTEISDRVASVSPATSPFRVSQLPATGRWLGLPDAAATSCSAAIEKSLSNSQVLALPRIAGSDDYLKALDQAVLRAINKEQSPAEALAAAAKEWEQITDRLGRDQQHQAYRRSLNVADWQ